MSIRETIQGIRAQQAAERQGAARPQSGLTPEQQKAAVQQEAERIFKSSQAYKDLQELKTMTNDPNARIEIEGDKDNQGQVYTTGRLVWGDTRRTWLKKEIPVKSKNYTEGGAKYEETTYNVEYAEVDVRSEKIIGVGPESKTEDIAKWFIERDDKPGKVTQSKPTGVTKTETETRKVKEEYRIPFETGVGW